MKRRVQGTKREQSIKTYYANKVKERQQIAPVTRRRNHSKLFSYTRDSTFPSSSDFGVEELGSLNLIFENCMYCKLSSSSLLHLYSYFDMIVGLLLR